MKRLAFDSSIILRRLRASFTNQTDGDQHTNYVYEESVSLFSVDIDTDSSRTKFNRCTDRDQLELVKMASFPESKNYKGMDVFGLSENPINIKNQNK